jgi:hypothetical protein
LSLIVIYLYVSGFGTHESHNGFLRFTFRGRLGPDSPIPAILGRFCRSFSLISAQDSSFGTSEVEYAYQLTMRSTAKSEQMLAELQDIDGLENINLTMQEQLLEV